MIAGVNANFNSYCYFLILQIPNQYRALPPCYWKPGNQKYWKALIKLFPALTVDSSVVRSEIAVLRSRDVAYSVVNKLKLDQDPEFNPCFKSGYNSARPKDCSQGIKQFSKILKNGWVLRLIAIAAGRLPEKSNCRPGIAIILMLVMMASPMQLF